MTCIVQYKTKKAFKEAVNNGDPVAILDPSIFNPYHGPLGPLLERAGTVYVTNHPKRSWFASVARVNGIVRVL